MVEQLPDGVSLRVQEKTTPEVDELKWLDTLYYKMGLITHPSLNHGLERTRQLLRERAKLYKKFRKVPKIDQDARLEVLEEAHLRDELESQFLNQGEVTVNLTGLGSQTSRYTILELPEDQKPETAKGQPPLVFIPGISNDLIYGLDLVEELAFSGRRVISIGYPESTMGKITPEFARASVNSKTYTPHDAYFKEAIAKLAGLGPIELWGHSTGSAVIGQMLTDPQFSQRVTNAVLLSPASSVDQSKKSFYLALPTISCS